MTSPQPETTPFEVEGGSQHLGSRTWQAFREYWSFGSLQLLAPVEHHQIGPNPEAANSNGAGTSGVQRVDVPKKALVSPPRMRFGKRRFTSLYEWEGVVQSVGDRWFSARLTPLEKRHLKSGRSEFTEFDFADLADESDIDLVREGSVFYWTIGRSRNEAGTIANQSLVRFRRVPALTRYQKQQARKEARDLMEAFGDDA